MSAPTIRPLLDGPFYFMRHGESTTNAQDLVAGLLDAPLSDKGRAQAACAAETLRDVALASIVVTGLDRAQQSAVPILEQKGLSPFVEPGFNERDWGELEGRPLSERPSTFQETREGESWAAFADRILRTARHLEVPVPTLIVGHAGTFRALLFGLGFGKVRPQLANATVVRFVPLDRPPSGNGPAWRVETLDGAAMTITPLNEDETAVAPE